MTMMFYCGVDPSFANTALVVLDDNLGVVSVKESAAVKKLSKAKRGATRLGLFYSWMRSEVEPYARKAPLVVGYEDYALGSTHKGETMGELGGALKLALTHSGAHKLILVSPGELKKFAVGNGQASKELLHARAVLETKTVPGSVRSIDMAKYSHDVTDAYFLAKIAAYYDMGRTIKDEHISRVRVSVCLQVSKRGAEALEGLYAVK